MIVSQRPLASTPLRIARKISPSVQYFNGPVKDIVRIVMPFGLDEPPRIAAIALRHSIRLFAGGKQVGISAAKGQRIEGSPSVRSEADARRNHRETFCTTRPAVRLSDR